VATEPIPDLVTYYAHNYPIGLGSEDDDQLYEMRDGNPVFRTDHQAQMLVDLVDWRPGARVLDHGCAKSSTFRKALPKLPGIELCLYDVSDRYRRYWDELIPPVRQAVNHLPSEWSGRFDVVTSFFSLEHIVQVREVLAQITALLAPQGQLYLVVPDVFENRGDFVVIDHVNHFTSRSLVRLLADAGLGINWVRKSVHRGALVALACKSGVSTAMSLPESDGDITAIANWWSEVVNRMLAIEKKSTGEVAIYGAGFYGSFIYATLHDKSRVRCFLDENPNLQGQKHLGVPVLRPIDCPASVQDLWIGLNPTHAIRVMASVDLGLASPRRIFFSEGI
jgi:SAM-dependent methyltransferase